jgi:CheY-like chemotaxis protein
MAETDSLTPVVLVVDDEADVRLSYRLFLEAKRIRVLEAADADAALKCLGKNKVDVVLTDVYMPGKIDGLGLVQALRERQKTRPAIIAISGSPHLAYRSSLQAARYVGADATLAKPIEANLLLRTIWSVLGKSHAA